MDINDVATQQALSAVRTLLAVAGASLVTHGVLSDANLQAVIGAIITLIPLAWGIINKRNMENNTQQREAVAVSAGMAQATGRDAPEISVGQAQTIIATKGPTL